jgi:uncharacterized protein (DUF1778 family)
MLAFHNTTDAIDEPSDARMQFRTKAHVKEAIQRAAALSGVDDSAFMVSAVYQSAMATIAAHERTHLDRVDHEAFFTALDQPPEPTQKLKDAYVRYQATVISK